MPGWKPLFICGSKDANGVELPQCTYDHMVTLLQNVITDLMLVGTLVAVIALIVVGFKLIMSKGNPGALKESRIMLTKIVVGFVIMMAAWLIIYTLSSALLETDYIQLGQPKQN